MAKKKKTSKTVKRKIKEIKKEKKIIKKDSELEEDIKGAEEIMENSEFQEFLQPTQISAPVLTKVETPTQQPLELDLVPPPTSTREEQTGIDYVTSNEPKYSNIALTNNLDERKYESEFRAPILRPTESGRLRQEILTPQREPGIQESQDTNRIETNVLEQKRREPFEREEKKYREVKF